MPAKIACPKCSKKYTLPDSALGKPVKCKECGTAFRTRKPGATDQSPAANRPATPRARPSKPAQPKPDQQDNSELKQFGLEGGFQKQVDIFGAPPSPKAGAGLGNFAEEGFGEAVDPIVLGPEGGAPVVQENPFQSVMTNSALNRQAKKTGLSKRGKKSSGTSFDPSAYRVARLGMMMVLGAVVGQLAVGVLLTVVGGLGAVFQPLPDGLAVVVGIFALIAVIMWGISLLVLLVGQVLCVFAPEKNEKLNAGGSLGLMFLAMFGAFILWLAVGISLGSVGFSGPSTAQAAAIGVGSLVAIAVGGLMLIVASFLFVNFYRVVGKNIKSKSLEQAGSQAMMAMAGSMGIQFLFGLLAFALRFLGLGPETLVIIIQGITLLNILISLAVAVITLRMIGVGVRVLRA